MLRQYEARCSNFGGRPVVPIPSIIATILLRAIGHPPWDRFLRIYHLYLQSIPAADAKAAWGINEASFILVQSFNTKHQIPKK